MTTQSASRIGVCCMLGCVILLGLALNTDRALAAEPAWRSVPEGRLLSLPAPSSGRTGFQSIPPETTGILFSNTCHLDRHLTNQILLNGSGVTAGDVDGDGWCDLYFCGLDSPNRLYRNLGNWRFADITEAAGVACPNVDATGAVMGDLDGDGDLDLAVATIGAGTHLFFNDGRGRFAEASGAGALNGNRGATSLALGDIDGDGDLDLFIANYRTSTLRDQPNTRFNVRMIDGKPVVAAINGLPLTHPDLTNRFQFQITLKPGGGGTFQHEENGEPDILYRNEGGGRFVPIELGAGVFLDPDGHPLTQPPFDWGLSTLIRDLNDDGNPDIYVCNDFRSPDACWLNLGGGRFQARPRLAMRQMAASAMGLDVADINRDGLDDILVLEMLSRDHARRFSQRTDVRPESSPIGMIDNCPQAARNMLYLNLGDGHYAEIAQFSGIDATEWAWTPIFLDVDLDGYEDLLVCAGFERDNMNVDLIRQIEALKKERASAGTQELLRLRKLFPRLALRNLAFRNQGNLRFADRSAEWGFGDVPGISQSMVLADLDNDGDQDVIINRFNGPAGLYRNGSSAPRLAVRLKGTTGNIHGIGARLRVLGGPVPQTQQIVCGGRYMGSDDAMRVFAAGTAEAKLTLEVRWRSGAHTVLSNVPANHLVEAFEPAFSPPQKTAPAPPPQPFFTDASSLLSHQHYETPFDDFERQPSLPIRLSQDGPGVAWFDLDGDGHDDLVIGSGRGGKLAGFRNNGRGGFEPMTGPPFDAPTQQDHAGLVLCRSRSGTSICITGLSPWEEGSGDTAAIHEFSNHRTTKILPPNAGNTGPLALADIDGDGDLDLFVGSRSLPARYPLAAPSHLFRNTGQTWVRYTENDEVLAGAGLVRSAVFTDLNKDGAPDLALACEWGTPRIFLNQGGRFKEATEAWGLTGLSGWWTGISAGDFNGDGRMDLVVGNWGQNTRHETFRKDPLVALAADLDGNGTVEYFEGYVDISSRKVFPLQPLHVVGAALPALRERFATCMAYSTATLPEILGDALHQCRQLRAACLESTLLLNAGDKFVPSALPIEAQLAPALGVCVADLDGDGSEDVFLSQNFFATTPDTSRYDGGRGLWLRGDGRGGFRAVPGYRSGLNIYGEQRGAAVSDFDGDGRTDLVVCQNGAATRLFRNTGARPGLRIRLSGTPDNPHGVGAQLRLGDGKSWGPARELHAGAGYWSQDSLCAVMASPTPATHLQVHWPGGLLKDYALPAGAAEVLVGKEAARKVR